MYSQKDDFGKVFKEDDFCFSKILVKTKLYTRILQVFKNCLLHTNIFMFNFFV